MIQRLTLKVCGMRDAKNISEIASLHPDYLGLIFYPDSPRFVGEQNQIVESIPNTIERVGVFVNATQAHILRLAAHYQLDCIQLHGTESPELAASLKDEGYSVWKVFSVDETFKFEVTEPFEAVSDLFLFDTKGRYFGGNAKRFDWTILEDYHQRVPFMLSGGITIDNLNDLDTLGAMNMHGIDVNSGVEISPGLKDYEKVRSIKKRLEEFNGIAGTSNRKTDNIKT